jgi:transcriptional regulator with XRE-family HTH domain
VIQGMAGFGDYITARRKALKLTQKDLAPRIRKSDGSAISAQYLSDVEQERRPAPTDAVLEHLAQVLKVPPDVLYFLAERMPSDIKRAKVPEERVLAAWAAFRREISAPPDKKKRS